nr:uncharacterized protein LOC127066924 [Vespula vulgaris]
MTMQNKSTQSGIEVGKSVMIIERKKKLSIPKDLNLITCWNIMGPELAEEFEEGYTHIPYILDTNAYKIGYIFVPIESMIECLCVTEEIVKVLGPLDNFVVKSKTNEKFLDLENNLSKRQPDSPNLRMVLSNKKREIIFTGYDCQFLDISVDMIAEGNIMIDRSLNAGKYEIYRSTRALSFARSISNVHRVDLAEAKWFGLITGVFTTKSFELYTAREVKTRTTYIGDDTHTVLFKYEICEINEEGLVTRTSYKRITIRWTSIMKEPQDLLPIPQFVSGNSNDTE